jgi:hypothetical protein
MRQENTMQASKQVAASVASVRARLATPASARTDGSMESLALQWFEQMRTGQIDRTQLAAHYSVQLTEDAVQGMSRFLKAYEYGASPLSAHMVRTHSAGEQTFHVVKLVFPRGDAANLLFGFDRAGRITGISLLGMAGD